MTEPPVDGATSLDPDEAADLIPGHITTQAELNEWEQANIVEAKVWLRHRRRRTVWDAASIRELHRRMFDQTWRWAGQYRRSNKNIGAPWQTVATAVHDLMTDVAYWIDNGVYDLDELAARLHHRLVLIHPFPNGNGRHARLYVDDMLTMLGRRPFSWGSSDLLRQDSVRSRYIVALRSADAGDIRPLLEFART